VTNVRVVLFVVVAVLVNLPWAREGWDDRRIEAHGHDVAATVLEAERSDGGYLVSYRLPHGEDPKGTRFTASVDEATYEHAVDADEIVVRVLKGEPSANRPLGIVPSSLFRWIAIVADVVLLAIAAGAWYLRRRPNPLLRV
jgi:hypothetical protein